MGMSFLKRWVGGGVMVCVALAASSGAWASDIRPGCYERVYSGAHLSSHPDQHVAEIRLWVGNWIGDVTREARMQVVLANQAQGRGRGGHVMSQFLLCGTEAEGNLCQVECDGGSLSVTRQDGNGLTFRTRYLMVGATTECGGVIDLAERPGQWVSYRLNRVAETACAGM